VLNKLATADINAFAVIVSRLGENINVCYKIQIENRISEAEFLDRFYWCYDTSCSRSDTLWSPDSQITRTVSPEFNLAPSPSTMSSAGTTLKTNLSPR